MASELFFVLLIFRVLRPSGWRTARGYLLKFFVPKLELSFLKGLLLAGFYPNRLKADLGNFLQASVPATRC